MGAGARPAPAPRTRSSTPRCCAGRPTDPGPLRERVSVLLPVRDEQSDIGDCVRSLLAQPRRGDPRPRRRLDRCDRGARRPGGRGRSAGAGAAGRRRCRRVARQAARVRASWPAPPTRRATCSCSSTPTCGSAPTAVAAAVARAATPATSTWCRRTRARTGRRPAERLVQPLLQWSWLTFVPLRLAETLAPAVAGGGQRPVPRRRAARPTTAAGGHEAVRDEVLDDVALAPRGGARRRTGRRSRRDRLAAVPHVRRAGRGCATGYAKSLWSAFGSPAGAARGDRARWASPTSSRRSPRCAGRGPGWSDTRQPWPGVWSAHARPARGPGPMRWRTRLRSARSVTSRSVRWRADGAARCGGRDARSDGAGCRRRCGTRRARGRRPARGAGPRRDGARSRGRASAESSAGPT